MAFDLLHFSQRVPKSGYEIVVRRQLGEQSDESYSKEQFLVERVPLHGRKQYSDVSPLQSKDRRPLFWRFGSLASSEDMIGFANEFGLLGGDFRESIWINRLTPEGMSDSYVIGESISSWENEIRTMRLVTELWQHAMTRGEQSTRDCLLRQCRQSAGQAEGAFGLFPLTLGRVLRGEGETRHSTAADAICTNLEEALRRGDSATSIALNCIVIIINVTLAGAFSYRLAREEDQPDHRVQLHLVPGALHQVIWAQFAAAVGGRRAYEECAHCAEIFEVPIGQVGRPSAFCSDACRMKAYRRRQAEARRLSQEGAAIAEIASRLGVRVESVERWTA